MQKMVKRLSRIFSGGLLVIVLVVALLTSFLIGYSKGYGFGKLSATDEIQKYLSSVSSTSKSAATPTPRPTVKPTPRATSVPKVTSWGGPQLWDAINKSRVANGVNPLKVKDELCTIASIRLNQLLTLGTLDGHEGFSKLPEQRPDLKWIYDKYNLSEFLVAGATSPQNAVDLWYNSLGHKKLLTGGEYVWGCVYAQNGFGVAIAAY